MAEPFSRRDLLTMGGSAAALGLASPVIAAQDFGANPATGTASLRARADRKGLLCGTAVAAPPLASDARLRDVLVQDCNILVPENELKWDAIQPTRDGPLNFAPAEAIYAFATANHMQMRGHALSWWESHPRWAVEQIPGMSPGAVGDLLTGYVTQVVTHWRGRLAQWDVVNEPINAKNDFDDKLIAPKLGEQFIDLAFKAAHAADPNVVLNLNATLIAQEDWWEQHTQEATLRLLERLLKRGVPIKSLGYEAHVMTSRALSEANWRRFLDAVAGMGLQIILTEIDVDDRGTIGDAARRDAEAAALVAHLLDITLSYPNCTGLLTWGPVDRYSWLRKMSDYARKDGALQRPTPRGDDYRPKPIWQAIGASIDRAPQRSPAIMRQNKVG